MNEPNSKQENQNSRRFSQEQYDMLKRCSEKKDMTEWNEWRKSHPDEDIWLVDGDFSGWYMEKADFTQGGCNIKSPTGKPIARNNEVHLERANFDSAILDGSQFLRAHLENARFLHADVKGAYFCDAHLENADLSVAHLEGSDFSDSNLRGAEFIGSCVNGANFTNSDLRGCSMIGCVVDGSTQILYCIINRYSKNEGFTDFTCTALNNVIITPGEKQLLEYNIRRMNWEDWYPKQHRLLAWIVRKFWWISDYGISTKRIIFTFFGLAFVFAIVYYAWGLIDYLVGNKDYPGIVSNLFVLEDSKQAVSGWLVPLRAVYFSIVTMTTLGFGDMYASAHSLFRGIFGHILLALQVTLGYVLLGALVTRFAVLFTAGGPAGKFADEQHAKTVA